MTFSSMFSHDKMCFSLVAGRTGKGLDTTRRSKLSVILVGMPRDSHIIAVP